MAGVVGVPVPPLQLFCQPYQWLYPGKSLILMTSECSFTTDLIPVTITPSATSVSLSWSQSSTLTSYRISMTRVTGVGNGQVLCNDVADEKSPIATLALSQKISNLEEFSTYAVTIVATFHKMLGIPDVAGIFNTTFTTLSAGKCT